MAFWLPLLAATSMVAGVGSRLASGYQQAKGLKAQEQAARIEAEMARIRGTQAQAQSRSDLATVLGNIDAIRTARGASLDSQTGLAIRRQTTRDALRIEAAQALAELNRASSAGMAATGYRSAARWAIPMAGMDALSNLGMQAAAMGGR